MVGRTTFLTAARTGMFPGITALVELTLDVLAVTMLPSGDVPGMTNPWSILLIDNLY
jgi:hypothetical protein